MENNRDLLAELRAPFDPEDVSWRVQTGGISQGGKPWAMIVPYITSRAIHRRLDEVFGLNWQNVQRETADGKGYMCGISVKHEGEWVTRWDGAEYTNIEPLKGALSGAMKRAGVLFGIGRYLYEMDGAIWAECKLCGSQRDATNNFQMFKDKSGKKVGVDWKAPKLPEWAIPHVDYTPFRVAMEEATTMDELKDAYKEAYKAAIASQNTLLSKQFLELKDSLKIDLEKNLALNLNENFAEVDEWLDKQIKGMFMVPNLSTVTTLYKTVKADLERRCEGQYFDPVPLHKKLDEALTERKKQLKG